MSGETASATMSLPRVTRRDLRLGSGLVLFAYVAIHFVDHALGLISLDVAEIALGLSVAVWHSLPGSVLLYGSAAVHVVLALLAVYERRTLRMPPAQLLRIALGLGMPVLLIGHVVATRLAADLYALAPTYHRIVWALWISDSEGRQLALQAPGWAHGCMGLHYAFGSRRWWGRVRLALFGIALLLPVLAALGFLAMGRELAALAADPQWQGAAQAADPATRVAIGRLRDASLAAWLALVALAVGGRELRGWIKRRRRLLVPIAYPQRTVDVPRGWSVLEASRAFGIPHLSMCGGNARCSTCRVRVLEGAHSLPPPSDHERRTLERIRAAPDVRLACQLRPAARVVVEPLLDPHPAAARECEAAPAVVERELALLLVRIAAWGSPTGGPASPHDTVYALNRVLDAIGQAVAAAGGQPGRFDNEGASAFFGADIEPRLAARRALAAAAAIERELGDLNRRLSAEVGFQAGISIALHLGPAVIGPVGRGGDRVPLPVGPTVRAARALRDHAVATGARFAISRDAAEAIGGDAGPGSVWEVVAIPGGGTLTALRADRVLFAT